MKNEPIDVSMLVKYFTKFHTLSYDNIRYLEKFCFECTFRKGKHLLRFGEVSKNLYFLKKGAVRGYVKEGTKEITTWITIENALVTSITSFDLQQPSFNNVQAIEDCELIGISYTNQQKLFSKFPEFNILGKSIYQEYYRHAEERALVARLSKAEYKYVRFLKTQPHLANRIPGKYIASYLGIAFETLSRIRKKISTKKKVLLLHT